MEVALGDGWLPDVNPRVALLESGGGAVAGLLPALHGATSRAPAVTSRLR
ncbi:hypothetical protein [Umezawaea tangerina]|nr:hypothetical protein [Umezawaea tangerina]